MGNKAGRTFAFSAFVFQTGTGELTRGQKRLRIPDQEARLLTLLLENPGEMVTRDELRKTLWPDGEVLDYDRSINRAVSQLRATLRDRSFKGEVIDTIPKRGYRLAVPVKEIYEPDQFQPAGRLPLPEPSAQVDSLSVLSPSEIVAESELEPIPHLTPANSARTIRPGWRFWALPLAAAILLAVFWLTLNRHKTSMRPVSLGIVPLEASGEGAAALAESFRLNLADVLSQSPEIETRSVHAFDHVGQDENLILLRAQQMSVNALLFGKFTVTEGRCELRLELVRSRDGVHISSLQYAGSKEELASISDRVERDIFDRLHPDGRTMSLNLGRPNSPKAYAAYLRGRSDLQRWTDESLTQAVASFEDALKEDPSYARADAGMASAYFVLAQHGARNSDKALEKAREFSAKALALDPTLAEAHAILGQIALNKDWDFPRAEEQLHRAVELDPDHAVYHQWLSILYCIETKYSLALQEIDKAHAADPGWAPLYMTEIFLAGSASQFDRANRAADHLLQMMPNWSLAHEQHAISLWAQGKYPMAIAEWRQAAVIEKNADRIRLEDEGAEAFRTGGVPAYAHLRLQAIRTRQGISHEEQDFVPAEWHAYAGDREQTLVELTQMVKERSPNVLQVAINPAYEPLHREVRYRSLLKQIGLPNTDVSKGSR